MSPEDGGVADGPDHRPGRRGGQRRYRPPPRKTFLIFFMARSGSTWLTDLCRRTHRLGNPDELFNTMRLRKFTDFDLTDHIDLMQRRHTHGGVFGAELAWGDVRDFFDRGATLRQRFPTAKTLFLIREDIVLQAVSTLRRVQTAIGHSLEFTPEEQVAAEERFTYDGEFIRRTVRARTRTEKRFDEMFATHGFDPVRLSYERNMKNPLGALNVIAGLIGEPLFDGVEESAFSILRTDKSAAFAERFRAEEPRFLARIARERAPMLERLADY